MRFDMRKDYVINGTQLAYVFACLGQEDIDEAVKALEDVLKVPFNGQKKEGDSKKGVESEFDLPGSEEGGGRR